MVDQRRVVGAIIHAKARHVTSIQECNRRFGANAKTKLVQGVVLAVEDTVTANNRTTTTIHGRYWLNAETYRDVGINIRSVIAGPNPEEVANVPGNPMVVAPPDAAPDAPDAAPDAPDAAPEAPDGAPEPIVNVPEPPGAQEGPVGIPVGQQIHGNHPNDNPVVSKHGVDWYEDDHLLQNTMVNGPVQQLTWGLRTRIPGEILREGDNVNNRFSRLEIFLLMFPMNQLDLIVRETNFAFDENIERLTVGKLLQFFGVLLLATKFEFSDRDDLWSQTPKTEFEQAANFGSTGVSRNRFNEIWQHIRFGVWPEERPEGMSSAAYRWLRVDSFVRNFNEHRSTSFVPGDLICVDESISRWYGQGGSWINHGLPMYVAIDRKPENGCEIQNSACARSGVLLRLRLVKGADEEVAPNYGEFLHGTQVMLYLLEPWFFNTTRIVCGDSFFASYASAQALLARNLRFIGVVKTATQKFPNQFLSTVVLNNRGDTKGLYSKDAETGQPQYMAFVWVDRDRRYFISTVDNLSDGEEYTRFRWRQQNPDPQGPPVRVELVVPQPKAAETYYKTSGAIDHHNRDRQDTLGIERKLITKDWSKRVNLTILAMIIVDTYKVYKGLTFPEGHPNPEKQKDFYSYLIAELIRNTYDTVGGQARNAAVAAAAAAPPILVLAGLAPRMGIDAHLTPTKKRKKNADGTDSNILHRGLCRVCHKKTSWLCSLCVDNGNNSQWLCGTKTGRHCYRQHMIQRHDRPV